MRLHLLPISTRRALIYSQRQKKQTKANPGYADRIITKATDTWAKWESQESGWQKKVTEYGNKAMQRIPFEEWGLKSVPPLSAKRAAEAAEAQTPVEVVFPSNVVKVQEIPSIIKKLGTERQSLHSRRLWWSVAAAPFTIPFALVPIVPNLPFFYLVYRAWSHYRALYGSRHLVFLVEKDLLKPISLADMENIYSAGGSPPTFNPAPLPSAPGKEPEETLLLNEKSHVILSRALDVPELSAEIERAVKQVRKAMQSQKEFVEEKQEIEKTNKGADPAKQQPPNR